MVLVVGVDVAPGVSAVRVVVLLVLLVVLLLLVVGLRVRVVVLLSSVRVVVLLVRVRVVVLLVPVGVVVLGSSVRVLVVLLSSVRVLVVSLPPRPRSNGRLPVRQRRVHQVVHGLEQVLDAVGRRDAGMAQVRDQLRRDVVHGHVRHRLAALGRGQGRGHLVLEEASQGGGQGPVALRVGDALILLVVVKRARKKREEEKKVEFFLCFRLFPLFSLLYLLLLSSPQLQNSEK